MKLCINSLRVLARIGDHNWEKVITQKLTIHCQLTVEKVIDYCTIANYIKEYVVQSHYNFIEDLGQSLSIDIKKNFAATSCQLTIEKHNCISNAKSAAVIYTC